MWPWRRRGKSKRRHLEVPRYRDEPMVAYVWRLENDRGVRLSKPKPVGGRWEMIHGSDDLEDGVADAAGGGLYKARFYDAQDMSIYLGTHEFRIAAGRKESAEAIWMHSLPKRKRGRRRE